MNKNKCFEPLKKYGGYVQTWEEYEEVQQIIEENLHKEKSTDKIEVLTRWIDPTIEEKDKEIERLNNIISSFEKRIITIKNKCEQILTEAPLDVRINERDKINLLDSVLKYLEELKEGK